MPELKSVAPQSADDAADTRLNEAAARLLRLRHAPDDAAMLAELDHWLAASRDNVVAWNAAQQAWALAGAVGPAAAPRPFAGRRRHRPAESIAARRIAAWSAAAIAAMLLFVFMPTLVLHVRADHTSAVGELRRIQLEDGSRIELDSDSAIAVDYAGDRRSVTLLAGQAFFAVVSDPRRPFVTHAGGVTVTVTGTAFDVKLASDQVSVAVAAGRVAVAPVDGLLPVTLDPGQRLRIARPAGSVSLDRVAPEAISAWRRGKLLVEGATIADLVAELRRYRAGAIVLTDDTLAARRITGVFDLTDPVRALKTIVEPHAGQVREITPWLLLVSGS